MHSRLYSVAAGVVATLAIVTAAGCGETKIDVDMASKAIDKAVETQVGARVRSVSCPDSVQVEAKATFKCLVTGDDGTKGDAIVTQKDAEGNLTFAAPFLHTREAEQVIERELGKRMSDATVSCPEIVVVGKGRPFACEAKTGDGARRISARQTDDGGNFTYRVG